VGRFEQVRANIRRAYLAGREAVRPIEDPEDPADPPINAVPVAVVAGVTGDDRDVPYPLRIAAAWSWRLLVVAAAAVALLWAVGRLHQVVVPVAISLLLSALLSSAVTWLRKRVRLHRSVATAVVMIGGIAIVAGTLTLVITQFVDSWPKLSENAQAGLAQIQGWLKRGPLHLSDQQLSSAFTAINQWVSDHRSTLTTGALSTATTALDFLASAFLVLFTTFFFLRDGGRIWRFLVNLLPSAGREPLGSAGEQSWQTLVAYVRATVLVAFIDAVGIGIGLVILRVDLAFPLAALVFLGAFIPIIGATLSGTVAILVAMVTRGPFVALLVLLVVIGVQQLEGHVLQPAIMGKAVAIHPLAVIMAIATGVVLAGIIGALVAVPITAVLNTGIRHLAARRAHEPEPAAPEEVVVRS
jgi:predicted PurR-regulated permease PerM